jgi:hypothetical protein
LFDTDNLRYPKIKGPHFSLRHINAHEVAEEYYKQRDIHTNNNIIVRTRTLRIIVICMEPYTTSLNYLDSRPVVLHVHGTIHKEMSVVLRTEYGSIHMTMMRNVRVRTIIPYYV